MSLSNTTLERVSISYRNGYRDGEVGNIPHNVRLTADTFRPFSSYDYIEGWKAGCNDALWAAVRSNKVLASNLEGGCHVDSQTV